MRHAGQRSVPFDRATRAQGIKRIHRHVATNPFTKIPEATCVPILHLLSNRSSQSSFENSKVRRGDPEKRPDFVPCPGQMKKVVWGEPELSRLVMALPN
jgi:hypothetical protein